MEHCTLTFFVGAAIGFFGALVSIVIGLWYLGVQKRKIKLKNDGK